MFSPDKDTYTATANPDSNWRNKLFLAGSIEMGKAVNWQQEVIEAFENSTIPIAIYNPRRAVWDASLEQSSTCETFRHQVTWEQKYLDKCNIVLMNLLPDTYSPISLLELGQLTHHMKKEPGEFPSKEVVVVCPKGFWRRGNVEMVCIMFKIPLYETLAEGIAHIKTHLQLK